MDTALIKRKAAEIRAALIAANVVRSPDELPFEKLPEERQRPWIALATVYIVIWNR